MKNDTATFGDGSGQLRPEGGETKNSARNESVSTTHTEPSPDTLEAGDQQQQPRTPAADPPAAEPSPASDTPTPILHDEKNVRETLGLSRDRMAEYRKAHFEEGVHWVRKGAGGRFQLTLVAVKKLCADLELDATAVLGVVPVGPAVIEETKVRVLRIVRPNMLLAKRLDSEQQLYVRVRECPTWWPGLEMPVKHTGPAGLWSYSGPLPIAKNRFR
jgi:hypothetical protein